MADYKELLRRAISALPENNGAARRAVYEKARSALVGQLRAIQPPLPARDITQHRLQLEDCIRQVEQEASEAVIMLGRDSVLASRTPAARPPMPPEPIAQPGEIIAVAETAPPNPLIQPPSAPADATSIEDIISQAAQSVGAPVRLVRDEPPAQAGTIPSIVARAEATKTGPTSPLSPPARTNETLKTPGFEARRAAPALIMPIEPMRAGPQIEPGLLNASGVRQAATTPIAVIETPPVEKALSSVREVDVEPDPSEAQDVIERAIETLDREARGEPTAPLPESALGTFAAAAPAKDVEDANFADVPAPQRSGAGLTIFLVVFAILLAGAGGAGFWAWREGYVDLDQMFGRAQVAVTETPATTPVTPTLDPVPTTEPTVGNTAATSATGQSDSELTGLEIDDRLEPTPEAVQPTGSETVLPDIGTGEVKTEERLPGNETSDVAATDPSASVDPAVLAGSQSLLLEASQDGTTGAVPFSGTVEWSEGVDELGLPTLTGTASIPARNLGVDITIRKNSDPSLPASHLMEVDFKVSDTFIGGTIANLPGILLKDEELVPGSALVGASARVVGNSFLFALSSKEADVTANTALLEDRRWMDLAVVYGTGRNAIITLEKDDAGEALFQKVFTAWAK